MAVQKPTFELIRVTSVRHVRDHVLCLEFSDGLLGEADLGAHLVGPILGSLREVREFARVRLGAETIEWPNGADWAPESLHALVAARYALSTSAYDDVLSGDAAHSGTVPEISRFYGIVISMFFADHATPHFHARCGGDTIAIEIDGDGIHGRFPPNRLPLVFEWREQHRSELRENWQRLRRGEAPLPIAPLE